MATTSTADEKRARWVDSPGAEPQYVHHKILPIRHVDGDPLSRDDIQYDLLHFIFSNPQAVFADPAYTSPGAPGPKLTFGELYINAILTSPKCTKVSRDKMIETPSFATEFGKMCLLVNIGRINTTLAFYHEMRTILRSYHPVPSLMKTAVSERNMMDAPRMKACLKACLLSHEKNNATATPGEVLKNVAIGILPPTSVVNLIFVLSNHVIPFSRNHFDSSVDFLDLFIPINISSECRAQAFLWTIFHYLEGPDVRNPFDDEYSTQNPGKAPLLPRLSKEEMDRENVDTPEEQTFAAKMKGLRVDFLKTMAIDDETIKRVDNNPKYLGSRKKAADAKDKQRPDTATPPQQQQHSSRKRARPDGAPLIIVQHRPDGTPLPVQSSGGREIPQQYSNEQYHPHGGYRHQPAPQRSSGRHAYTGQDASPHEEMPTLLQHTFNTVMALDPFDDSDNEPVDEREKYECERRVWVMSNLRGRGVTPEPEPGLAASYH